MEEKALLVNIATIIGKDIALDNKITKINYPSHVYNSIFEDDDEDGLDLLVYEMQKEKRYPFDNAGASKSPASQSGNSLIESSESEQGTSSSSNAQAAGEVTLRLGEQLCGKEFQENLHISKDTFNKLFDILKPLIAAHMRDINGKVISEKGFVSLGLWKLATDEHFEKISRRFKIPLDICHWGVNNFCTLLSTSLRAFVKWPKTPEDQSLVLQKAQKYNKYHIPNSFGIITSKKIDVFLESQDEDTAVVLQLVCTSDQILIDCYVDLATSYSFDKSPLGRKMSVQHEIIPKDCFLVGDMSLPLRRHLIRPFSNPANEREEQFNAVLESNRSIINSVIDKMTKRFHSLYALEARSLREVKKVIEAICVLHNLCQSSSDDSLEECNAFSGESYPRHFADDGDEDGQKRRSEILDLMFPC